VHVRLILGIYLELSKQTYGAITDKTGYFPIASISPGYYTVDLKCAGFAQGIEKYFERRTEIELYPGEHRTGWKLEMSPLVMIAGRVVNQYGDPVPNVEIIPSEDAIRLDFSIYGSYQIKHTDERGRFRLFTPPGSYYLAAKPDPFTNSRREPEEVRSDGTSALIYDLTYFPDASDTSSATRVEAKPGHDITGIEIHLRSNAPRFNLTVSGVVTKIPAGAKARIVYHSFITPDKFSEGGSSDVGTDGRFTLNSHPGYVRLQAQCPVGNKILQSEPMEIHLDPPGATNVQLALVHETKSTISGTVEIIGEGSSAVPADTLFIQLWNANPLMSIQSLQAKADSSGSFRIANIPPGRYRLEVYSMPENAYMKSVLLDKKMVDKDILDFTHGVNDERLRIIISRNGGQISGEVRNAGGWSVLNPRIMVILVPEQNQIVQVTRSSIEDGKYLLKGVPPGRYKIYAMDPTKTGTTAGLPGDSILASAEILEVPEGGHVTKNLVAVTREESNVQPQK
jgi:hypothetical protein